jgi:hypothetical protein
MSVSVEPSASTFRAEEYVEKNYKDYFMRGFDAV